MKPPTIGTAPDPILAAIQAFRDALAAFNASPPSESQQADEAKIVLTYGPPLDILMTWDQPALSYPGAVEAIRLAAEENADYSGSEIADNMVRAALGYFDAQVGAASEA